MKLDSKNDSQLNKIDASKIIFVIVNMNCIYNNVLYEITPLYNFFIKNNRTGLSGV